MKFLDDAFERSLVVGNARKNDMIYNGGAKSISMDSVVIRL